jgi:exopolyphosphatase/guanosine-5'-triphosphate,3'-diphosphate pyrophosphatase
VARYGAIDIGSNSIRMKAAECSAGQLPELLAEDRDVTRLGESVFRDGVVSAAAIDRTRRVLERMADKLRSCNVQGFRAVATSAIRDARNQEEFLKHCQLVLGGVRPEIISGAEEARLVHLGVQTRWPENEDRLIIDIGGGSAEVIESRNGKLVNALSKPLGAVRLTDMFFQEDPPSRRSLVSFTHYVREKIAPFESQLRYKSSDRVVCTAATAASVWRAILGMSSLDEADGADRLSVTTAGIRELFDRLAQQNLRGRQAITGIGPQRAEIIVAGAGVLTLILESLGVESCFYCSAGVRDGVISDLAAQGDLLTRPTLDADQRQTVSRMAVRYEVSLQHAERVAELAVRLFADLQELHGLESNYGRLLEAAAYLHDTGHFVSSTRHHRHSHYLVANADLPGFDADARIFIAALCRYHRKNMPKSSQEEFTRLSKEQQGALLRLIPLLRIADSLDRSHRQVVVSAAAEPAPDRVSLRIQADGDAALEQWAVEQHQDLFAEIYGKKLRIEESSPGS